MAVKKPFGGYQVNFASVKDMTVGEVFGTKPMTPSDMTKKIWVLVKGKKLSSKG